MAKSVQLSAEARVRQRRQAALTDLAATDGPPQTPTSVTHGEWRHRDRGVQYSSLGANAPCCQVQFDAPPTLTAKTTRMQGQVRTASVHKQYALR